jgi:hypothetical protein
LILYQSTRLAGASATVLENLCSAKDLPKNFTHVREIFSEETEKQIRLTLDKYRNFFKHADKDPKGKLIGFKDKDNEPILFMATQDCRTLLNGMPISAQVFQGWYFACYPEKLGLNVLLNLASCFQT